MRCAPLHALPPLPPHHACAQVDHLNTSPLLLPLPLLLLLLLVCGCRRCRRRSSSGISGGPHLAHCCHQIIIQYAVARRHAQVLARALRLHECLPVSACYAQRLGARHFIGEGILADRGACAVCAVQHTKCGGHSARERCRAHLLLSIGGMLLLRPCIMQFLLLLLALHDQALEGGGGTVGLGKLDVQRQPWDAMNAQTE